MILNDKYTVNLRPGCGYSGEPVRLSQYDTGRVITFDIFNGTEPFTIGSYTVKLEGTRSDGMAFPAIAGTKVSGSANTVQFVIDGTVSKSAGRGRCEIVIYNGSERVGSGNVLLIVEKAGMKSDALIDNVATSEQAQAVADQLASLSSRLESLQNNGVDSADIQSAVNDYLSKNPVSGGSSVSVSNLLTSGEVIATLTVNGQRKDIRMGDSAEQKANKATVLDDAHNNDNWYPSAKAVMEYVGSHAGSAGTGITSAQIDLLEQILRSVAFTVPNAGATVDAFIASLRGSETATFDISKSGSTLNIVTNSNYVNVEVI